MDGSAVFIYTRCTFEIRFELDSNTKLEYEITEDIWNFREQVGFALPINNKISFWIGDEPRLFSLFERAYFGENEALALPAGRA